MFFTRLNSKKKPKEKNCRESGNDSANGINVLVPIMDYEQGRIALNVLRNNRNDQVKNIRIFQCVKDQVRNNGFVNPVEVIQASDAQDEQLEHSFLKLQRLAEVLTKDLPDVRISFNSRVHCSVSDAIVEEARLFDATIILFVQNPQRKRHWLIPGVSNRVLRTAPCSVQIIKPSEDEVLAQGIVA